MAKSQVREYIEAILIAVVLALFIITFIAQSFLVQGSSMEPSLQHGQRLMVDKLSYRFTNPKRGDVVVFRYPSDERRKFIKRIIGLPGDEILIRNGYLHLNGTKIEENFINGPTYGPYSSPSFGPVTVPQDSYFVLGDNRRNSDDSRYPDVGFVTNNHIVGLARFSYWPLNRIELLRIPEVYRQ